MSRTRRTLAALVPVAGAAALVAGILAGPADAHGEHGAHHGSGHHSDSSVPGTALKPYRQMFAAYRDVAVAEAHQYGAITDNQGIACIADPGGMGAMGIHYVNPGVLTDGMIDRSAPEAFVYAPGPHGKRTLVAVEYIVFKADWDATHDRPPELFAGHPFDVTGSPNRFDLPAYYSQHVWAWRGNPNGNLDMWNPTVHCPAP
jgi:hypothetical protein